MKYLVWVLALVLPFSGAARAEESIPLPPAADKSIDFDRDIAPILREHCLSCHNEKKQESLYRLDSRKDAIESGVNAGSIVPGDSANSLLVWLVAGAPGYERMPVDGDPLTALEIGTLRAWIDQGVPWRDPEAGVEPFEHEAFPGVWRAAVVGAGGLAPDWAVLPDGGPGGVAVLAVSESAPSEAGLAHLLWRAEGPVAGEAFSVSIKADGEEAPCGGVLFGFQDKYNYHLVTYDGQKNLLCVARVQEGDYGALFRAPVSPPEDGWLGLEIAETDGAVTVRVGGDVVLQREVRSLKRATGKGVGLWMPAGRKTQFSLSSAGR